MTDKELKSLSKIQMLSILHQQEEEIERLKARPSEPSANTDAALINEIVQAAQQAADSYLSNIRNVENDKIDGIAKLEKDARRRCEEAEMRNNEVTEIIKEKIADMDNVFIGLKELVESMHADFKQKLMSAGIDGDEYVDMQFEYENGTQT